MNKFSFRLDLFERIVNECQEAIVIIDEACRVVFWNHSAERIFGFTSEMALGREVHELITPPRHREQARRAHRAYVTTGDGAMFGRRVEIEALNCMGQEFWIELSISDVSVNQRRWAFALMHDITERRMRLRMLEQQASTDALSGLCNRRAFKSMLESSAGAPLALALVDIDDFKLVNDAGGHALGDAAIQLVGRTLQSVFDDALCIGRLGGDEFAVLMGDCNATTLRLRAEQLRHTLEQAARSSIEVHSLSVSLGIARDPHGEANASELLGLADRAMYESKRRGKQTFTVRDVDSARASAA